MDNVLRTEPKQQKKSSYLQAVYLAACELIILMRFCILISLQHLTIWV